MTQINNDDRLLAVVNGSAEMILLTWPCGCRFFVRPGVLPGQECTKLATVTTDSGAVPFVLSVLERKGWN